MKRNLDSRDHASEAASHGSPKNDNAIMIVRVLIGFSIYCVVHIYIMITMLVVIRLMPIYITHYKYIFPDDARSDLVLRITLPGSTWITVFLIKNNVGFNLASNLLRLTCKSWRKVYSKHHDAKRRSCRSYAKWVFTICVAVPIATGLNFVPLAGVLCLQSLFGCANSIDVMQERVFHRLLLIGFALAMLFVLADHRLSLTCRFSTLLIERRI